mgnify:FL=1
MASLESSPTKDDSRRESGDTPRAESIISKELTRQDINPNTQATIKLVGLDIKTITSEDIQLIQNVERLSLRKNQLVALPKCFGNLRNLRYLDLNTNNLRDIPHILQQCPQLEILDLSCNKIKTLPLDVSQYWAQNLKVLSLKNNRLSSIFDLRVILALTKLNVLEIEGNNIPNEELDMVQSYTPVTIATPKDEYWAFALRRFFEDHPEQQAPRTSISNTSSHDAGTKMSRASKRMGFINTARNGSIPTTLQHSPKNSNNDIPKAPHSNGDNAQNLRRQHSSAGENSITNGTVVSSAPSTAVSGMSSTSTPGSAVSQSSHHIGHSPGISHNTPGSGTELYNHTKYNDYFKRLSILPEETVVNEESPISHAELVAACRKLLFAFTECQQAIRKIASFCKEKSIAVSIVSLLYAVRSHIDNLVEILEQMETKESGSEQGLIKLCVTIISNFKQIITLVRKNFTVFFEEDDLCFIRMFYMTLLCSYSEIYNAWSFISPEFHIMNTTAQKKPSIAKDSSALSFTATSSLRNVVSDSNKAEEKNPFEQNLSGYNNAKQAQRARGNTLQGKVSTGLPATLIHSNSSNSDTSFNGNGMSEPMSAASDHSTGSIKMTTPGHVTHGSTHNENVSRELSRDSSPSSLQNTHGQEMMRTKSVSKLQRSESAMERERSLSSPSSSGIIRSTSVNSQHMSKLGTDGRSEPMPDLIDSISNVRRGNSITNGSVPTSRNNSLQGGVSDSEAPQVHRSESGSKSEDGDSRNVITSIQEESTADETEQNIDRQLYEMLINVTRMVSVVYNQLTNEISRIAMASTTGQQTLTDELLTRIRGLTDTCCQALDLSKTLNERLQLLVSDDPAIVDPYLSDAEKLVTWENINAFLKSIISILGSTKSVMTDLPNLNEIRPHLASLAKITKDVTVILDLSSYKAVSVTAVQMQKQQMQQQQQQQQQIHAQQQIQQAQTQQVPVPINSHTHVPLLTPQPLANNAQASYPFEQSQ